MTNLPTLRALVEKWRQSRSMAAAANELAAVLREMEEGAWQACELTEFAKRMRDTPAGFELVEKPVAWLTHKDRGTGVGIYPYPDKPRDDELEHLWQPLYAAPQPSPQVAVPGGWKLKRTGDDLCPVRIESPEGRVWFPNPTQSGCRLALALLAAAPPAPSQEPQASIEAKYNELLYAVASKFPGESRHQTALRYIMRGENQPPSELAQAERK